MLFREIPGHKKLIENLIRSINNDRLGHAQLFIGQDGSAALPLALASSQYIMCQKRKEDDSCGTCPSCLKHAEGIHPDIHYIFPIIPSRGNKENLCSYFLPQWREALSQHPFLSLEYWYNILGVQNQQGSIYTAESDDIVRKLSLKSYESDFKILVLWLPEKMVDDAANKLLKIIEEPPEKTYFFLVTTNADSVLPTIRSRCQHFKIPEIAPSALAHYLSNRFGWAEEEALSLANSVEGNIGRAIEAVKASSPGNPHFDTFVQWMRLSYAFNVTGISEWIDQFSSSGREQQKSFFSYTLHMLRNNLMMSMKARNVHLTEKEENFSEKFSPFIHKENIYPLYQQINTAYLHIENNANPKIVMMDTSFKIHHLLNH